MYIPAQKSSPDGLGLATMVSSPSKHFSTMYLARERWGGVKVTTMM